MDKKLRKFSSDEQGFGHIIIPSDVDREDYIIHSMKVGRCMILTKDGDCVRSVLIPKNQISLIEFPIELDQLGSLVKWSYIKSIGQVVIDNIYFDGKEINQFSKDDFVVALKSNGKKLASDVIGLKKNPVRTFTIEGLNEEAENGGFHFRCLIGDSVATEFVIGLNGEVTTFSKGSVTTVTQQGVKIQIGPKSANHFMEILAEGGLLNYQDSNGNSIKINESGVVVDSKSISLGHENYQPMLLGTDTVKWLEDLIDAISALTVGTSTGPSTIPINIDAFQVLKEQLELLKSKTSGTQ